MTTRQVPSATQNLTEDSIGFLRCPACESSFSTTDPEPSSLVCRRCGVPYPIIAGIPRFTEGESYTASFGYQWKLHSRTQLDRNTGFPLSRDRFYRQTGWNPAQLRGARVLEAGCGAGRFTDVVLDAGAEVWAIDYSLAVEANIENHPASKSLHLAQADLHKLPFPSGAFDFIFCFGVLQHTRDPRNAFLSLLRFLKPGTGLIAVDIYPRTFKFLLHPKYVLRPLTRRLPREKLYALVRRTGPFLLSLSDVCHSVPLIGRHLARLVPIANYRRIYPLSEELLREWAILDTFDWFSPRYDRPATLRMLRDWFNEAGLTDVEVQDQVVFVGRGRRPAS